MRRGLSAGGKVSLLVAAVALGAAAAPARGGGGKTERVSVGTSGGGGAFPSISADGRFVAFTSPAANLVKGDTNEVNDVFIRRR